MQTSDQVALQNMQLFSVYVCYVNSAKRSLCDS